MAESIKELRRICQEPTKNTDSWYYRNFPRRISIYFTKILLITGFTANQVTVLALAMSIISGILLSFGDPFHSVIGALLFQVRNILDCVDGEIARYRGSASISGEYLELLVHG